MRREKPGKYPYAAVILDLDGVVTATRHLHILAWKSIFDEYLAGLRTAGDPADTCLRPFDPEEDYVKFVDGKPREDGVRSFLASRGIFLPEGTEKESGDQLTIRGLGLRKNLHYLRLLKQEGPHLFADALEALRGWTDSGIPIAVVSSSRNCAEVLKKAGIEKFFAARVDGVVGAALALRGKPAPDYFLEAARRLKQVPGRCAMVEDAVAGVQAGRRGGFGWVIGMDRSGKNTQLLLKNGADRVVSSLREVLDLKNQAAAS